MTTLAEVLSVALTHHREGRLAEAEALYREIIATLPDQPDAWHLLGVLDQQRGRADEALVNIGKAIDIRPTDATFQSNYGSVLNTLGRYAEAVGHFEQSLAINPAQVKAWYNYGNALRDLNRKDEAIAAYERSLHLDPNYLQAHTNVGVILRERGRLDEAIVHYRAAVKIDPTATNSLFNLSNALRAQSESSAAAQGRSREQRVAEIVALYQEAIRLKPDYYEAHTNLGVVYKELGRLDDAVAAYQAAILHRPTFTEAHSNLALAYQDLGQLDLAKDALARALELRPKFPEVHSNLVFVLNYDPAQTQSTLLNEHRRWSAMQTAHIARQEKRRQVATSARPLRVGYVSPDFRSHPVGRFMAPVFEHHDRSRFTTMVYSDLQQADAWTSWLRARVDSWHDVTRLSDGDLLRQIEADEIDILVDLAGHTSHHRLGVFARRATPVQVTYLGYPNTTGLETIDYLLTDSIIDPPGSETGYTEKLVRLDPCFSCYRPPDESPEVSPLPARTTGVVTFGALHGLAKLNARVIDLWSHLLLTIPNSRLLVFRNTLHGSVRERLLDEFARRGVGRDRIELSYVLPASGNHLLIYEQIDVALDVFPWSGHTTACEATWMGVPTVTLLGDRHAGRMVASVLNAVGKPEWIASSPEEYIDIAARLAADIDELAKIRERLRDDMRQSPQCDGAAFTQRLERAYETMWAQL